MMTELFSESPVLLGFITTALAIASFFGWLKSGSRGALASAVVFVVLLPALLVLERYWVTDREQIRADIESLATLLEAEQYDQIFAMIDPTADTALARAKAELPNYEFESAKVTSWRSIRVNYDPTLPEAIADFSVVVVVSHQNLFKDQRVPRRVRIAFRKQASGWRVVGYEHLPVVGNPDGYSNIGSGGEMPAWDARRD